MTENMAARGEGLAGAIACVKEFIAWATEQIGTSEAHGCAEQAEDALKLLEAAAPAGTAPDVLREIAHIAGAPEGALPSLWADTRRERLDQIAEIARAALATPSPQAPAGDRTFSTTSAREQSPATAAGNLSVADLPAEWRKSVEYYQGLADAETAGYAKGSFQGKAIGMDICAAQLAAAVPAATQEQPAGSGADCFFCHNAHVMGHPCSCICHTRGLDYLPEAPEVKHMPGLTPQGGRGRRRQK